MDGSESRSVRLCLVTLIVLLAVTGCTRAEKNPAPEPHPTTVVDTVTRHKVGDRFVVTAAVVRVPAARAFIVADADLPAGGLLVLGGHPDGLRETDLVTADGTIELFAFDRFKARYELADQRPYAPFEGHKILVADSVRSWA
jgi:hypothetical protein